MRLCPILNHHRAIRGLSGSLLSVLTLNPIKLSACNGGDDIKQGSFCRGRVGRKGKSLGTYLSAPLYFTVLEVLAAIGGWGFTDVFFSQNSPRRRISSSVSTLCAFVHACRPSCSALSFSFQMEFSCTCKISEGYTIDQQACAGRTLVYEHLRRGLDNL